VSPKLGGQYEDGVPPKKNFPPFAFKGSRWTGDALRAEMTPKYWARVPATKVRKATAVFILKGWCRANARSKRVSSRGSRFYFVRIEVDSCRGDEDNISELSNILILSAPGVRGNEALPEHEQTAEKAPLRIRHRHIRTLPHIVIANHYTEKLYPPAIAPAG
jgi:hypothetical protein